MFTMNQSFENSSKKPIMEMNNVDCGPSKTHPAAPEKERVDNDLYYDMSGEKKLIIFNHYEYEDNKYYGRPSERTGTDVDKKNLEETFENLGFNVVVADDFKYCEIIRLLKKEVAELDHTRTSCIAVAILTHGTNRGLLFAADTVYPFSEVEDIILNEKSLSGKPKLFFLQGGDWEQTLPDNVRNVSDGNVAMGTQDACRGDQEDIVTEARLPDPDMPLLDEEDDQNIEGEVLTVPTRDDTLVLYACREGFKSYRNKEKGSRLIESLCRQIRNRHADDDIQDIITRVKTEVVENESKKRQTPESKSTLTKKLKF